MIKNIKLLIVISIIFILSSCAKGSTNLVTELPRTNTPNNSESINYEDFDNGFTFLLPVQGISNQEIDYNEFTLTWNNIMKDKFGIDIKIEYINFSAYKINELLNMKCLLSTTVIENPIIFKEGNNQIYNLKEYLENNETWQRLPEHIKQSFNFGNGIWALPIYVSQYENNQIRIFDKEYFSVDKNVISLDSFYNILHNFPTNSIKPLYINGVSSMVDVFNGFGLAAYNNFIIFDTEKNVFNDVINSNELEKCIEWTKAVYDEGLIDIGSPYDKINPESYYGKGSTCPVVPEYFLRAQSNLDVYDDFHIVNQIYNNDYQSVKPVHSIGCEGYLIPKTFSEEEAKSIVKNYMNIFFSSIDGIALGSFGLSGLNYEIVNETIIIKYKYQEEYGVANKIKSVNIMRLFSDCFELLDGMQVNLVSDNTQWNEQNKAAIILQNERTSNLFENVIGLDFTRFMNIYEFYDYGIMNAKISSLTNEIYLKCIDSSISYEEMVAEYENIMKKENYYKRINEVNEILSGN